MPPQVYDDGFEPLEEDDGFEEIIDIPALPQAKRPNVPVSRVLAPPPSMMMLGDFAEGFGKSALNTISNVGSFLTRGSEVMNSRGGPAGVDKRAGKVLTPPPTAAGKAGEIAETITEFAIPSAAVGKAAKAVKAATGSKLAGGVARIAGEAGSAGAVETARTGGDVGKAGTAAALGGATSAAIPALGIAGRGLTDLLGKTTGAGGEAVRTALSGASDKFFKAMRGGIDELEIVGDMKEAVGQVRGMRAQKYRQQLDALPTDIQLDKLPAMQTVLDELPNFGARMIGPGKLEFEGRLAGSVNQADTKLMEEAVQHVSTWMDRTPKGMDQLKQLMDDLGRKADPRVAPFFYRIRDAIKGELESKVLGYKTMTADYAETSKFLNMLDDLSTNAKNPGTAVRKMATILNQNNNFRKILVEALDAQTGSHIKDEVAGYALSSPVPRGLAGVGAGTATTLGIGGVLTHFLQPQMLAGLLVASPRAVGETMALISMLRRGVPASAARAIPPAVASQSGRPNQLPPPPTSAR